jgi:precorrin-6Y C5,15-methyltransferase (decarboxylating)
MTELPAPTHAFIGGSSGNLKDILNSLKSLNPEIRIVINAISIETVCEIKEVMNLYGICNDELVQVQVSRADRIGSYNLMKAENPVWIFSFNFGEA